MAEKPSSAASEKPKRFRAQVGIDLADGTRVEAGQLVPVACDVPGWLVEQGHVREERK